jgi:hypothetical protein
MKCPEAHSSPAAPTTYPVSFQQPVFLGSDFANTSNRTANSVNGPGALKPTLRTFHARTPARNALRR